MTLTYQTWSCSHTGRRRAENSDAIAIGSNVWALADGFGAPDRASEAAGRAAESTVHHYEKGDAGDSARRLREAVEQANREVHSLSKSGLELAGTTLVAAAVQGQTAYIGGIGRCRAYLIRDRSIQQLTEDHTWIAAQIAAGNLTEDEAGDHPKRNVVTRALGPEPEVQVDIIRCDL
ncbi:MAG: PP2C family protein-serine/threonine phosphatase, partial [Chloroflexota bacterium]